MLRFEALKSHALLAWSLAIVLAACSGDDTTGSGGAAAAGSGGEGATSGAAGEGGDSGEGGASGEAGTGGDEPDSGVDGGTDGDSGDDGCGCKIAGKSEAPSPLALGFALFLTAALIRRRTR